MRKKLLVTILLLTVAPLPALASGGYDAPTGKWWERPAVVQALALTEAEKKALDDAYLQSQRRRIDLRAAMQKQKFELDNLLSKDVLDEGVVLGQFDKYLAARDVFSREQFQYLLVVRKKLGTKRLEQLKTKLKELRMAGKKQNVQRAPAPKPSPKKPQPAPVKRLPHKAR